MSIVGNPDAVVGGVDTHVDMHVAAVVNHVGGTVGCRIVRYHPQRVSPVGVVVAVA